MLSYMCKKNISDKNFRRISGVKRDPFQYLMGLLKTNLKGKKSGPKNKLSLRRRLLLTLDYWRNYGSLLKTGEKYGVSEATACRVYELLRMPCQKLVFVDCPARKVF